MTPEPATADQARKTGEVRHQDGHGMLGGGIAYLRVFGLGGALLLATLLFHIAQGPVAVGYRTILEALFAYDARLEHEIVRHLRLPRAASGVVAGATFAVAGALFQSVTRNPLTSPATLGVNAGSFLAVVAGAALFPAAASGSALPLAFVGGLGAAGIVLVVSGGLSATPVRMALAGMAVAMSLAAAAATLQILFQERTAGLFFWGAGTLIQNGWGGLTAGLPWVLGGVLVALALSRSLDVLALGDDTARGLGQPVRRVRFGTAILAVFLAATGVTLTGPIGFVGLVAPHLVRMMGLRSHLPLILGSALWGALLLVGADVAGRMVSGDLSELPAGVITALLGTPFLIWLAHRLPAEKDRGVRPTGPEGPATEHRTPYALVLLGSILLLLTVAAAGLAYGAVDVSLAGLLSVLSGAGTAMDRLIVLDLRLPRILAAALAGACLAASGLLLQGVVRNPLAAPELVGVMSGAGVGAMTLLLVFPAAPVSLLPVAAFVGAVAAFSLVYAAAWRDGITPERLALVGIGVSAFGAALINIMVVRSDMRIAQALVWLSGSTYAQALDDASALALWALVLVPVAWVTCRHLDLLALGEESATGLGLGVERTRLVHLGLAVGLAAAAVATVGTVGFVGLIAPHAARLLTGGRHRRLVPLALVLGAVLLVGADVVGRTVLAPKEIPSGLVAAVLGAPYFVWLLRRAGRAQAA